MKSVRNRRLLATCGVLAIGHSVPVMAQEAASSGSDIIVTARRIEERLQDVPISMTVFDQQQLADRNVTTAADLAAYTPSLSVDKRFGSETASFAIRGFTKELRTAASVAVYFADVVSPRGGSVGTGGGDGVGPGAFFDLANVQVLKGPQGTLFGRNTTGGAVLLVPRKPSSEFGGYVEGSIGNYDMKRVEAVLNLPVSDTIRLRLGVDRQKRDGYLKNISGIGPKDFADTNYIAARASLVIDVTPDIENYTIGSYTKLDSNGSLAKLFAVNPANTGPLATLLAAPQVARQQGTGFYTVQNSLRDAGAYSEQWQIINTTNIRLNDDVSIKNIVSYAEYKAIIQQEVFGSNFITPAFFGPLGNIPVAFAGTRPIKGTYTSDQSTFSEELQIQGTSLDGGLVWQGGVYYESSKPLSAVGSRASQLSSCSDLDNLVCTDVLGLAFQIPPGSFGSVTDSYGTVKFTNLGIYGQATYSLTSQLKITGGLRYTHDKSSGDGQILSYRFTNPANPSQYVRACADPGASLANNCVLSFKQTSKAPTWTVDLDYKPSDDTLLYAKWARGYRQGSVNAFGPAGFNTFGPEKVDLYELGFKSSFRGAVSGTFNIAAFYNDFRDQQLQVGVLSSTNSGPQTTAIINAGKSRIWGFEVDSSISPAEFLKLDFSYAYLNTKLISAATITPPPGSVYDIFSYTSRPGDPLPFTPKHKLSATATVKLPVPESAGQVSFSANFTHSGEYITAVDTPFGKVGNSNLVNLNLNWASVGGLPVDLAAFVTNLTQRKYTTFTIGTYNGLGFDSQALGEPRMYGLRLKWRFGDLGER